MKLVRYANDFVVLVSGRREDAEALWDEVATVLAPMGLRLPVWNNGHAHRPSRFVMICTAVAPEDAGTLRKYGLTHRTILHVLVELLVCGEFRNLGPLCRFLSLPLRHQHPIPRFPCMGRRVSPSLKSKIARRMLQGVIPSKQAREQAFNDANSVPDMPSWIRDDGMVNRSVGSAAIEGTPPRVYKGYILPTVSPDKSVVTFATEMERLGVP